MMNSAAHDFAEDIAAALVRGEDAVGDEESSGTGMIGNYAERSRAAFAFFELFLALEVDAAEFGSALHQRHKQIRIVVGDDTLEHGGDAFKPHAGVNAGLWQ